MRKLLLFLLSFALFRDNAENMHFFSSLALTLNEQEEGIAPTDSRLRPDQRLMEVGLWDEANGQKQRLEERQRLGCPMMFTTPPSVFGASHRVVTVSP